MLSLRRVMNSSISTCVLTHFISGTGSSGLLFTFGWYGHTWPFLGTPHRPHLYDPRPLSSSPAVAEEAAVAEGRNGPGPPMECWFPGVLMGAVEAECAVVEVRVDAVECAECIPG